jgi:hypothetical protein
VNIRQRNYLTAAVMAGVFVVLVGAFFIRAEGALEATTAFLSRWFFAIFCTIFSLAQVRVYGMRRRRQARVASHVPSGAFGLFTVLWLVMAIAAIVYGVTGVDGWWEIAAWAVLVVVICVQLIVLGGLEEKAKRESS